MTLTWTVSGILAGIVLCALVFYVLKKEDKWLKDDIRTVESRKTRREKAIREHRLFARAKKRSDGRR